MEPLWGILPALVALAVVVVLFLVFRALVLWYWKLDKIEGHLRDIRDLLARKQP